jgi:YfiH family protein
MKSQIHWGNRKDPLGGFPKDLWETTRPRWRQVHGVAIAEVTGPGQECGEVDGLWTRQPGIPVGVVTADCVPILMEHASGSARAALHAGWRGVFARIPEALFRSLPPELAHPADWRVSLGPSIRACCYEVGTDLIESFDRAFPELPRTQLEPAHRRLDLIEVVKHQFEVMGSPSPEVHPACTFCSGESGEGLFQSYRRGDRHSRQLSIIV